MSNAIPNYEVKIYMDPLKVLNSTNDLKLSIKSYFGMPSSVTKINCLYLDSTSLELNSEGWDVRIRKLEGINDFEIDYKKRYPISNNDIDSALSVAAIDGFDNNELDYEAQIDWGYAKQTLSFSNTKHTISGDGYNGMDLPTTSVCRDKCANNCPGKLNNWLYSDWGKNILIDAHRYGDVTAKRSIGTWNGFKFYIEVWKIINIYQTGYDYVIEASFKTDYRTEAQFYHDELINEFKINGWLLPMDQLKTQMILNRY